MILELLWWAGLAYFASWAALPLLLVPLTGPYLGLVLLVLLAPWTSLAGMVLVHRLLPTSPAGTFQLLRDRGSVAWALKGWAPSIYLGVFQAICFTSESFQRLAFRAFGMRLGAGSLLTSRTVVREPHLVGIGAGSLVGEYAHLIGSFQPRLKVLVVAPIEIGDRVLVGAYSHIGPGARVADDCLLEYDVRVGPGCEVGRGARIGSGTTMYSGARIGAGAKVGKDCLIRSGAMVPEGAVLPDGTQYPGAAVTAVAS